MNDTSFRRRDQSRFLRSRVECSVIGIMDEVVIAATQVLKLEGVAPHLVGTFLNDFLLWSVAPDYDRGYGKTQEASERLTSGGT